MTPSQPHREIKFRIWHPGYEATGVKPHMQPVMSWLPDEPVGPVMQYTGLKDKNGKEIYDGDLLHAPDSKLWFKIEWLDGAFCLVPIHAHDKETAERWGFHKDKLNVMPMHVMMCKADLGNLEVIGNIYENPELEI